jgi:hypothetical protein
MRHGFITATALGAALLFAPPIAAQTMQGGPGGAMPHGGAPHGAMPHAAMPRAAGPGDATGMMQGRDVEALLRQAEAAVGRGNWAQATELVERAETSLLNTHVLGSNTVESGHVQGQALGSVGRAREAIARRDRAGARSALQTAVADAGRVGQESAMPRAAERQGTGPQGGALGRTGAQPGPTAGAVGGGAAARNPTGTAGAVPPGLTVPDVVQPPTGGLR